MQCGLPRVVVGRVDLRLAGGGIGRPAHAARRRCGGHDGRRVDQLSFAAACRSFVHHDVRGRRADRLCQNGHRNGIRCECADDLLSHRAANQHHHQRRRDQAQLCPAARSRTIGRDNQAAAQRFYRTGLRLVVRTRPRGPPDRSGRAHCRSCPPAAANFGGQAVCRLVRRFGGARGAGRAHSRDTRVSPLHRFARRRGRTPLVERQRAAHAEQRLRLARRRHRYHCAAPGRGKGQLYGATA